MNSDGGVLGPIGAWQFTIALIVSIVVFGGGTMAATILGREVPNALWAIDGGLANALVAHAAFFNQRAMHAQSLTGMARTMESAAQIANASSGGGTGTATTTAGEHPTGGNPT